MENTFKINKNSDLKLKGKLIFEISNILNNNFDIDIKILNDNDEDIEYEIVKKDKIHTISSFMENYIKNIEEWIEIETDIDFNNIEPFENSSSLHVIEYRYKVNNNIYRLLYSIEGSSEPVIQILKNNNE